MREQPDELIRLLEFTPHSKKEYDDAWFDNDDTDIEKARKFIIRTQQSIWAAGAQEQTKGWSASFNDSRVGISEKTQKWLNGIKCLPGIVDRFRSVQIENRDFKFILNKYDTADTLFYLDPPYDQQLRSSTKYEFDFVNQDFFDLQYHTKNLKGKCAISGYDTPFMSEVFKHFNKHIGPQRKNHRSTKEAKECLWTNY